MVEAVWDGKESVKSIARQSRYRTLEPSIMVSFYEAYGKQGL